MAKKNQDFENEIKQVVGMHVKAEVERLEKKVDSGFAEIKDAIEGLKKTMVSQPAPSAPAPAPSGGSSEVHPGLRPTPGGLSFAEAVGAPGQQPVVNDVTTPSFFRRPNPTKLFCNLHDRAKVSKNKFVAAISVLALEANVDDSHFSVVGDALDNRFELQFCGDGRVASLRAMQFYESLQLGRGQWKKQVVENDQGIEIKFYVAPDKNPCQMRREILSKHVKNILLSNAVDKKFFLKKATGSIYEGKRVVCSVIVTGPETARLDWCHPKRIELCIEQAPVEQEFSNYVVSGGPGS